MLDVPQPDQDLRTIFSIFAMLATDLVLRVLLDISEMRSPSFLFSSYSTGITVGFSP